jgi:5-methylcytosine-specific restriction protein A
MPIEHRPYRGRRPWANQGAGAAKRLRGRAGQRQRQRRLERSNGLCERCLDDGRVTVATVVDHVVPLARGGEDVDDNTRNLCDPCHEKATAEQFGRRPDEGRGIGVDGRPTAPNHPWNRPRPSR